MICDTGLLQTCCLQITRCKRMSNFFLASRRVTSQWVLTILVLHTNFFTMFLDYGHFVLKNSKKECSEDFKLHASTWLVLKQNSVLHGLCIGTSHLLKNDRGISLYYRTVKSNKKNHMNRSVLSLFYDSYIRRFHWWILVATRFPQNYG